MPDGSTHANDYDTIVTIQCGDGQLVARAMNRPRGVVQRDQVLFWQVGVLQAVFSICSGSSIWQTHWRAVT